MPIKRLVTFGLSVCCFGSVDYLEGNFIGARKKKHYHSRRKSFYENQLNKKETIVADLIFLLVMFVCTNKRFLLTFGVLGVRRGISVTFVRIFLGEAVKITQTVSVNIYVSRIFAFSVTA